MVPPITDSHKRYRLRSCPQCGGSLYWDEEEKEWHCLDCARQPERPISTNDNRVSVKKTPISTDSNPISTTETPLKSTETPAISKRRRPSGPEKIYRGHAIEGAWWSPREITFRRRQMLFLIKSLPELRAGYWPANPVGSGYIDLPMVRKGGGRRNKAYFETPCDYASEVEARLEKCGINGLILLAIECWGESEQSLEKYFGIPPWSIRGRAKKALRYISGWERRRQSYKKGTPATKGKS